MNIEEAKQLDVGDMVVYYNKIATFIINGKESKQDYGLITDKGNNDEFYIEWMSEDGETWHFVNDDSQNFWRHIEKVQ